MKLRVENFGPVKEANMEIKPLTIIIGKNNLGKSYLAQLIYTLLTMKQVQRPRRYAYVRDIWRFEPLWRMPYPISTEEIDKIGHRIVKEKLTEREIVERITYTIIQNYSSIAGKILKSLLEQTFGMNIGRLINLNSSNAQMECKLYESSTLLISISNKDKIEVKLNLNGDYLERLEKNVTTLIQKIRISKRTPVPSIINLLESIKGYLFRDQVTTCIYIPAGRAGLLESYDTVASALISLSPVAPIRGISMPPLPGMASQFYDIMLQLRGESGPLEKIAESFKDLFSGDVVLKSMPEPKGKVRITYEFRLGEKESTMDIIHAASMIKELAPLYLIIRELVRPGSFLIIEEPESHLHPGAQCKLVSIVAELINKNVNVILTTHSDIMLRKVSHLIGKYKLDKNMDSLDPEKIAIYLLKEADKGSITEKLEIPEAGLLEEIPTFDEVIKELYDEEISLQQEIQSGE